MGKKLKLADILVTVVIAVVFGIIYRLWGPLTDAVKPLGIRLDEMLYGMWFIAGTVAALLIRKPGVALLAEVAASSGELLAGSQYGVPVLISGLLQGLFAELAFAAFGYKRYTIGVASLAAVGATAGSLIMDFYNNYITDLAAWNLTLQIGARTVGSIVICGFFAYYLVKALEATGVTKQLRPVSKAEYDALED